MTDLRQGDALCARLEKLTDRASDILITTNDRYQVGRADGILEAVEAIERVMMDSPDAAAVVKELLVALNGVVRVADRNTAEFVAAKLAIAKSEGK